ncbi:MAG: hypothetical protein M5U12_07395 [Verrucomicrobia bacterium]|nr:hypothetical protein [Verrucomicrobiota bacterium]
MGLHGFSIQPGAEGCEQEDARRRNAGHSFDGGGEFEAGDLVEGEVHQHDFEGLALGERVAEASQRVLRVFGFIGDHAPAAEGLEEDTAAAGMVVDDERAQPQQRGWRTRRTAGRGAGWQLEGDGEGERGADVEFAGDLELAAHEADELAGDGQAQAGATVLARGRAIGLTERFEDALAVLGGDAGTGVLDFETKGDFGAGGGGDADADVDLAAAGELDGVADEVVEDLAEADGVTADERRGLGFDPADEVETLEVGGFGEQFDGALDGVAEVELDVFEGEVT